MQQALEERKLPGLEQAHATPEPAQQSTGDPSAKRRRRGPAGAASAVAGMGKELSAEQKAVAKMNVTRETTDGVVKCVYCDKEISSKNVDRWASHLRGCVKTPEDVKAQIQPYRNASTPPAGLSVGAPAAAPRVGVHVPVMAAVPTHMPVPTGVNQVASLASAVAGGAYNETFKVHVSKDYMKFNAAHFIAYKGFREKLHGHNYQLAVTITGVVGADGYVVDFGEIKKISRVICKDLNESFLVPMNSDALKVRHTRSVFDVGCSISDSRIWLSDRSPSTIRTSTS